MLNELAEARLLSLCEKIKSEIKSLACVDDFQTISLLIQALTSEIKTLESQLVQKLENKSPAKVIDFTPKTTQATVLPENNR